MRKSVLAYGDSLTWGAVPGSEARHGHGDRWPNVVADALPEVEVISDGLRGRTTAFDVFIGPANVNGAAMLPSVLHTHAPLDLVVVMLGTNDAYCGFGPDMAGHGLARLIEIIRHHPTRTLGPVPAVLVVAPPVIIPCAGITQQMIDSSAAFRTLSRSVAQEEGAAFFDSNDVARCSDGDGFHMDAQNTHALGTALAPVIADELDVSYSVGLGRVEV